MLITPQAHEWQLERRFSDGVWWLIHRRQDILTGEQEAVIGVGDVKAAARAESLDVLNDMIDDLIADGKDRLAHLQPNFGSISPYGAFGRIARMGGAEDVWRLQRGCPGFSDESTIIYWPSGSLTPTVMYFAPPPIPDENWWMRWQLHNIPWSNFQRYPDPALRPLLPRVWWKAHYDRNHDTLFVG